MAGFSDRGSSLRSFGGADAAIGNGAQATHNRGHKAMAWTSVRATEAGQEEGGVCRTLPHLLAGFTLKRSLQQERSQALEL